MLNTGFAGNEFCGNVPRALEGVVRSIVGSQDGQQLQVEVLQFLKPCPRYLLGSTGIIVVTGNIVHSMLTSVITTCIQRSGEAYVAIETSRSLQDHCIVCL